MSIGVVLAMQKEIDPGLEIALVGSGFLAAAAFVLGRFGQIDRVGQCHLFWHDDLLFAGGGQTEVLAGG